MAAVEVPLQGANAMLVMNGSFTFVDPVQPAQMPDAAEKKRARDEILVLADDSEAYGWSSAILDRTLALRHRRSSAPSSCRRGCILVTDARDCHGEEAVPEVAAQEVKGADQAVLERQGSEKAPSAEELVYLTVI